MDVRRRRVIDELYNANQSLTNISRNALIYAGIMEWCKTQTLIGGRNVLALSEPVQSIPKEVQPGKHLYVEPGIHEKQIRALISHSQTDPLGQIFTSDAVRFASLEAFEKWRIEKDRTIYILTNDKEDLCGIAWLGKKQIPDGYEYPEGFDRSAFPHTIAVRVYEPTRGQGIASKFESIVIRHYSERVLGKGHPPDLPYGIWAEMHVDNVSAIRLCTRVGFRQIASDNKVVMAI